MTPDQVDALDPDVYVAFVQFQQRTAREIRKANKG